MAHRGGVGVDIDVARVSRREQGMNAYEVMLSESQERMLIVVRPGDVAAVQGVFERWDLHSDVVGRIIETSHLLVRDGDDIVCDLPLEVLIEGTPPRAAPGPRPLRVGRTGVSRTTPGRMTHGETLLRLLSSPNIGSRRRIFRTYDHQVGDGTVLRPGTDAALLRVPGSKRGLALTTDGNALYTALNPRLGAAMAVCEAARNVVATGAVPTAMTNCLNFANPERAEVYWDLHDAIEGMAEAATRLSIPVVSGNVSLYNESGETRIDPTVVIGMVGVIDDVARHCTGAFTREGYCIALVGSLDATLAGSELQHLTNGFGEQQPLPTLDLDLEQRVHAFMLEAIGAGLVHSAHDVAEGGLAVALAECAIWGGLGAHIAIEPIRHRDRAEVAADPVVRILFGEGQSRFLISYAQEARVQLQELATGRSIPLVQLGVVAKERLTIDGVLDVPLSAAQDAYDRALLDE
jgi:phosphoribosylformylglycinamidine synthase